MEINNLVFLFHLRSTLDVQLQTPRPSLDSTFQLKFVIPRLAVTRPGPITCPSPHQSPLGLLRYPFRHKRQHLVATYHPPRLLSRAKSASCCRVTRSPKKTCRPTLPRSILSATTPPNRYRNPLPHPSPALNPTRTRPASPSPNQPPTSPLLHPINCPPRPRP